MRNFSEYGRKLNNDYYINLNASLAMSITIIF